MKNRSNFKIYLVMGFMAMAQSSMLSGQQLQKFGTITGEIINEGYVFIDGKYIEAPYMVSRKGLEIFINDRKIEKPTRHPGINPIIVEGDPTKLTFEKQQKIFRALNATKKIYEDYLKKGYCYLFFSQGRHIRLDEYSASYDIPRIIEILQSDEPKEEKLEQLSIWNWHLFIDMEILLNNFSVSPQLMKRLEQQAGDLLRTDDFGVSVMENVDQGFMFLDGKYLDSPYLISRKGLGIFINNTLINRPERWPINIPSGDIDPDLPPEINSETSINDDIVNNYLAQKFAYLRKHHTKEEEIQIMKNVLVNLPFVTTAKVDEKNNAVLHITTTEGLTVAMALYSFRGRQVGYNKEDVKKRIEARKDHLINALKKDGCYFISRIGGVTQLTKDTVINKLPVLIKILREKASVEEKYERAQHLNIRIPKSDMIKIIKGFSATKQLEKRLDRLIKCKFLINSKHI
ncbi:hypothetical protein ACFL02_00790 [Planctomycetota bacterium]